MNKSMAHVSGEWVLFLNGGDLLFDEKTLEKVAPELTPDFDIVYGANLHDYGNGVLKQRNHRDVSHLWKGMQFSHQSMYARASLLRKFPYDIQYHLMGDYKFVMQSYFDGAKFKKLPFVTSITEAGGRSDQKRIKMLNEQAQILIGFENNIFHIAALKARFAYELVTISLLKLLKK